MVQPNMIILGLGSNEGDRLHHLRRALWFLEKIPDLIIQEVSPVYISEALLPDKAPSDWNQFFLNAALRCQTALDPHDLLKKIKTIEKELGHSTTLRWAPRAIDIDILAWDDRVVDDELLQIPHKELMQRPFALWPLADLLPFWVHPIIKKNVIELTARWGSRWTGEAPFHTKQIAHRIDTSQLMGIINVTPDSFSDGGQYVGEEAIKQAEHCVNAGAEVIDIGAEATNPHANAITGDEEWRRLAPILEKIVTASKNFLLPPKISIDTRHPFVAQKALDEGVDWINDVSGGDDLSMQKIIASHHCDFVIMHHLGIPADRKIFLSFDQNPIDQVLTWAKKRLHTLEKNGIERHRIIFDVGIGFGKNGEQCLHLIKNIDCFQELGCRLLVGHSRKFFLGQFTSKTYSERDIETTVMSLFLSSKHIDYLRVHHVEMHARAFKVAASLQRI